MTRHCLADPRDVASLGPAPTDTRLVVSGLAKSFGGVQVVSALDFAVEAREIVGLLGPNGAGKSTTLGLIAGTVRHESGHIHLGSKALTHLAQHERARAGVAYLFQDIRVFPRMSVLDNVLAGARMGQAASLRSALVRRRSSLSREHACAMRAREILASLGMHAVETTFASQLSYGQQKLVALARLVVGEPKLLLLDEPFAGLQDHARDAVARVVANLTERGAACVIVEHDVELVLRLAGRVVLMQRGSIVGSADSRDASSVRRLGDMLHGALHAAP